MHKHVLTYVGCVWIFIYVMYVCVHTYIRTCVCVNDGFVFVFVCLVVDIA